MAKTKVDYTSLSPELAKFVDEITDWALRKVKKDTVLRRQYVNLADLDVLARIVTKFHKVTR